MTIKNAVAAVAETIKAGESVTPRHPASVAVRSAMMEHGLTSASFRLARRFCDEHGISYRRITDDGLSPWK